MGPDIVNESGELDLWARVSQRRKIAPRRAARNTDS
jgi:hypothetical protein